MADPIKLAERLSLLFQHLGIRRAIVAGSGNQELGALATAAPDLVSAMIVVCPAGLSPALRSLASRLLLIHGDCGPSSSVVPLGLPNLPGARALLLEDFFDSAWANPIEERLSAIAPALLDFVDDVSRDIPVAPVEPVAEDHGEVAGITYHVQGCGLPLVLFPIHLSSSQWEPLLPILNQHFRTITLGGVFLYPVSILEQRARTGFRDLVGNLIDACELRPGERVLEVGCGSGALARWLADRTRGANPIVGLDFNPFLLREAADLVAAEGVTGHIHFQQGDATALPFPANSFDVTMAITVLEEGDADRMLAEMVRVIRPGGRVAIAVRAADVPKWVNLELPPEVAVKAGARAGSGRAEAGCSDASLYPRMRAVGLCELKMGPQLAITHPVPGISSWQAFWEAGQLRGLDDEETQVWRAVAARATAEGTYMWADPFHCAVGTKREH